MYGDTLTVPAVWPGAQYEYTASDSDAFAQHML